MSSPDPISTSVSRHDGIAVIAVSGDVDLVSVSALQETVDQVVAEAPAALVIDLSKVDFLASAGLRLLAATHEEISKSAQFAVVANGPATSRPIHLTGLDETLAMYATLEDALTRLRDGKLKN